MQLTLIGLGMLSKTLLAAAAASRPGGGDPTFTVPQPLLALLAAGICVLIGWGVLRLARPEKLYLRRVPGRPNHLNVIHIAGVFLIYVLCAMAAQSAMVAAFGVEPEQEQAAPGKASVVAGIFSQVVLFAASVAVASMAFRHGLRRGAGLSGRRFLWDSGRAAVGFLAVLPLCMAALWLTQLIIRPAEHPMLKFILAASPAWKAITAFSAVVLAPLAEEVFFRGLVQSMLRRYLRSGWPAILLTSVVFAASHAPQYQHMPALFLLGICLGYNYERTGRLLAPILLHAIFNGAMIWGQLAG